MIDSALYYGIMIASAAIEVAFFTLLALFAYRWISKRPVNKAQAVWVFATLIIFNGTFAVITYLTDDNSPVSYLYLSLYILTVLGIGVVVAHITASDKA